MDVQQIISEVARLPLDKQKQVIEAISANLNRTDTGKPSAGVPREDLYNLQIAWLKANRERYAGQYVALVGDELVAHGATFKDVREQARARNFESPFITKVFAEEIVLPAGL